MERGIYFDGWYKNNHCYHPSLPFRSMQMIEDLEKYKGTILVWSALGGGSISLPFLEHEAFGEVDPRLRFYGFMNDSEFIEECNKRGIKVFGIVFEVQGWEFPAEFNEDGTAFKGLNVLRDETNHDWYGLREFTSGKHDKVFGKSLKDYFPEGLFNSDGVEVKDLWSECAAIDYKGEPVHSNWVEVVGHKHIAYQMCRNNPVWRQYLKKIMEIQIDAGVPGIQLDECELPITSIQAGGCFCNDCRKQFREYLKDLKVKGELDPQYHDIELDTFDYKVFINERGLTFPKDSTGVQMPLFKEYWHFQVRAVKKYFTELVDHAKEYGKKKGKDILVSGNFFNLMPVYYPIETKVDVIITEMRQTVFKQPYWYRYSAGFAGDKTIVVAENPYGGIVPELVEMLETGNGFDLYRIFLLEASVYGCNMAVPYGGWMGNTIKDSFTPPRAVTEEVQTFLADNENLYSKKSGSNVAVLYSFPSYYWRETALGYSSNLVDNNESGLLSYKIDDINNPNSPRLPFWEVIKTLSDKQVNYDIKLTADGDLRADEFSIEDIRDYDLIVLPDCDILTENQTKVFEEFVNSGSKLLIFGRAADNVSGWLEKMIQKRNVIYVENPSIKPEALENFEKGFNEAYEDVWQLKASNKEIGIQMHKTNEGRALHVINYNYSKEQDKINSLEELKIDVRFKESYNDIQAYTLDGSKIEFNYEVKDHYAVVTLYNVPIYAVLELK
jgi:hypothetical protein